MNGFAVYLPMISAVFGTACMFILLIILLIRYFATALFPKSICAEKLGKACPISEPVSWKRAFIYAGIWFSISRLFIFIVTAVYASVHNQLADYTTHLYQYWAKWDAPHYIGLIKNWYVNEGDPRFHIVFFPMYPLVCRILMPLLFENPNLCAMLVSNVCGYMTGVVLYQFTSLEHQEATARRATRFFFLNPLSFFLSIPYTESLFLLLTIGAIYLAKRRKYIMALLFGAMCAGTRLMGIVVAIPIFYSMLLNDQKSGVLEPKHVIVRFLSCFAVLLGAVAYLLLNWRVTGNPFQFLIYQEQHWYQTPGSLWNTFDYIVRYAICEDRLTAMSLWLPTIVAIYGAILLIALQMRKTNAGDAAYAWAYMYMTIVPTWLISGPRYVSGLYALYPMLANVAHKKWTDITISILFAAGLAFMSCMFVFTSNVY